MKQKLIYTLIAGTFFAAVSSDAHTSASAVADVEVVPAPESRIQDFSAKLAADLPHTHKLLQIVGMIRSQADYAYVPIEQFIKPQLAEQLERELNNKISGVRDGIERKMGILGMPFDTTISYGFMWDLSRATTACLLNYKARDSGENDFCSFNHYGLCQTQPDEWPSEEDREYMDYMKEQTIKWLDFVDNVNGQYLVATRCAHINREREESAAAAKESVVSSSGAVGDAAAEDEGLIAFLMSLMTITERL